MSLFDSKRKKIAALFLLCTIFLAAIVALGIKYSSILKKTDITARRKYISLEKYASDKKSVEWTHHIPELKDSSLLAEEINEFTDIWSNDGVFLDKIYSADYDTFFDRAYALSENESPEIRDLLKKAGEAGPATSPQKALQFVSKAREIKPDSLAVAAVEAAIYKDSGNIEKAIQTALEFSDKHLKRDQNKTYTFAMIIYSEKKYDDLSMEIFFNNVLNMNGSYHEKRMSLSALGQLYLHYGERINDPVQKKRYMEAAEKSFIALLPVADKFNWAQPYINLGLLYKSVGQYKKAEDYFLKAIALAGKEGVDERPVYDNLLDLYNRAGYHKKAERLKKEMEGIY